MLRGHMKCCPSAVNIILLKGHTIPYLVRNVWYLVKNMWLPSRCTSHSPSAPYASLIVLRQAILRKKLLSFGNFAKKEGGGVKHGSKYFGLAFF